MQGRQGSSEAVVISDLQQARIITDRTQLRRLAPFMGREINITDAAAQLGLSVPAMYKIARRFVALKLLQETRQMKRAGRAIRYYCAPAEFFVPFSVLGLEQIGELNRQAHLERFNTNLAHTLRCELPPGWGTRTGLLPSGERYYSITSAEGELLEQFSDSSPLMLSGWNLLKLTRQEARTLQRQLVQLLEPYLSRPAGGEEHYLTGIFLVRDGPQE
ncbi:hypothetical protein [Deinococcus cavernae]|nr:hypothetical protein [Deinococcus cavernae]